MLRSQRGGITFQIELRTTGRHRNQAKQFIRHITQLKIELCSYFRFQLIFMENANISANQILQFFFSVFIFRISRSKMIVFMQGKVRVDCAQEHNKQKSSTTLIVCRGGGVGGVLTSLSGCHKNLHKVNQSLAFATCHSQRHFASHL